MDEQSQKRLAEIVAKQIEDLTEADAEFLRARRAYLNDEQRAVFADVLRGVSVAEAVASQPADITHVVTQQDLDNNPGLSQDVQVGDVVTLPTPKALEEMTKAELTEIAKGFNLEVGAFESKAKVIDRIRAAEGQLASSQSAQ